MENHGLHGRAISFWAAVFAAVQDPLGAANEAAYLSTFPSSNRTAKRPADEHSHGPAIATAYGTAVEAGRRRPARLLHAVPHGGSHGAAIQAAVSTAFEQTDASADVETDGTAFFAADDAANETTEWEALRPAFNSAVGTTHEATHESADDATHDAAERSTLDLALDAADGSAIPATLCVSQRAAIASTNATADGPTEWATVGDSVVST